MRMFSFTCIVPVYHTFYYGATVVNTVYNKVFLKTIQVFIVNSKNINYLIFYSSIYYYCYYYYCYCYYCYYYYYYYLIFFFNFLIFFFFFFYFFFFFFFFFFFPSLSSTSTLFFSFLALFLSFSNHHFSVSCPSYLINLFTFPCNICSLRPLFSFQT